MNAVVATASIRMSVATRTSRSLVRHRLAHATKPTSKALARAVQYVLGHGGGVQPVGDDQQLAAVAASGRLAGTAAGTATPPPWGGPRQRPDAQR